LSGFDGDWPKDAASDEEIPMTAHSEIRFPVDDGVARISSRRHQGIGDTIVQYRTVAVIHKHGITRRRMDRIFRPDMLIRLIMPGSLMPQK
jgi:hypothetical protein